MTFAVILRCLDGTSKLTTSGGGPCWERGVHDITWTVEQTRRAAERTIHGLNVDRNPTCLKAWIEERP
jgi:hypothetical protein